jgi:uncharacterized Rmd1/YagE family protein
VPVTEFDEIRQRTSALEQRVDVLEEGQAGDRRAAELFAVVDRDVADLREGFRAQRHVLQALRDTQLEQGRVLVEHGHAIGGIVVTLQNIQDTLAEQGRVLSEQSQVLAVQGRVLSEQGRVLSEQDQVLAVQGQVLAEHGRVLARLDPGEDPD